MNTRETIRGCEVMMTKKRSPVLRTMTKKGRHFLWKKQGDTISYRTGWHRR